MPHIIDNTITFTFDLLPTTGTIPANLDVIRIAPDGQYEFDEAGIGHGAAYIPPTDTVAGSYIFDDIFDTEGAWTIGLATGISTDHLILFRVRLYLKTITTTAGGSFTLP